MMHDGPATFAAKKSGTDHVSGAPLLNRRINSAAAAARKMNYHHCLSSEGRILTSPSVARLVILRRICELLTLGHELDAKQAACRLALARVEQTKALAAELWPELPASIVIASAADRRAFQGCFEQAGGFRQPTFF